MKKVFTLLTLLLCAVTGAWADTVVLGTPSTSQTSLSDANGIVTITDASGSTGIQQGSGGYKITYDGTAYVPMKLSGSRNFTLSYKEGVTISKVTLMAMSNGDAGGTVGAGAGDATSLGSFPARNNTGDCLTVDITGKAGLRGSRQFLALIVVDYSISGPVLSVIPNELSFSLNPKKATDTQNFTLTGENLTDGTYNLNIPSVAGLSVSPTSFTVADGAVNQEFAVTYASTADVALNTVNITTPTIDGQSAAVAVTYKSRTTLSTLQSISAATTWDFSDVTSGEIQMEGEDLNRETVYADFDDATFKESFDAMTLAFMGQFPFRSNCAQNGTLHFITTVPGTITVDFSDTGSSASADAVERYLCVNGTITPNYTKRNGTNDKKTSSEIAVAAGDVYIKGVKIDGTSTAIRVYKIVFTPGEGPAAQNLTVTIPASGWASFSTSEALDFSGVSGLKAYIATAVSATSVTLKEVEQVPGGVGFIMNGTAGNYDVPVTFANVDAISGNLLKATSMAKTVTDGEVYALKDGKFHPVNAGTIPAGKAYLPASEVPAESAAELEIVIDGMTTGIKSVETQKQVENGVSYNLAGQRVAQPTKGLYIVNGKKVIVK